MKKTLSVIMAVLMLLSAWSIFDTGANAADCTHPEFAYKETVVYGVTCEKNGMQYDVYYCTSCTTYEIIKNVVSLKATGHDYDMENPVVVNPTCAQAGSKTYTCLNDPTHTYTEKLPVVPHMDKEPADGLCDTCGMNICLHEESTLTNAQEATCSSEGYTGDECCKRCGLLIKSGKILPVLDHKFGNAPVEVMKATCVSNRVEILKCKNCPETLYDIKENTRTDCTVIILSDTEPTCVDCGYFSTYCTYCGNRVIKEIPPTGHTDENLDGKCDILGCGGKVALPGGQKPPCDCLCHSDSSIEQFLFKVIIFFCKLIKVGQECECGVLHY